MCTMASGLTLHCQKNKICSYRIIISTLSTLGYLMCMGIDKDHFTYFFLDEASLCSEPETMLALSQVSTTNGQVVLAGDAKQLSSMIRNQYSKDKGLSISFLERILKHKPYLAHLERYPDTLGYNKCLITKLKYNYRSLASIIEIPNRLYYNSELITKIGVTKDSKELAELERIRIAHKKENIPKNHAVFFFEIFAEDKQDADSPSWYNLTEAHNVNYFFLCFSAFLNYFGFPLFSHSRFLRSLPKQFVYIKNCILNRNKLALLLRMPDKSQPFNSNSKAAILKCRRSALSKNFKDK